MIKKRFLFFYLLFLLILSFSSISFAKNKYLDCSIFLDLNSSYYSTDSSDICLEVARYGNLSGIELESVIYSDMLKSEPKVDFNTFSNYYSYSDFKYYENISNLTKTNKNFIKSAFNKIIFVNPSILNKKENLFIVPNKNISVKVEFDFNRDLIPIKKEKANSYPDTTTKGYCEEEYNAVYTENENLYLDSQLISSNSKKTLIKDLSGGFHDVKSTYSIKVDIESKYTSWESYCCDYNTDGVCIQTCQKCPNNPTKTEIIKEELYLIDTLRMFNENNFSVSGYEIFKNNNKQLFMKLNIPRAKLDKNIEIGKVYKQNNYGYDFTKYYQPKNIVLASLIEDYSEIKANSNFQKLSEEVYQFPINSLSQEIEIKHLGFFYDEIEKIKIQKKKYSYVGGFFEKAFFTEKKIKFYPYIFLNSTLCENCSILADIVEIQYGNKTFYMKANGLNKTKFVEIEYIENNKCVNIYYKGNDEYYSSTDCVNFIYIGEIYTILKTFFWFLIFASIIKITFNKGISGRFFKN